MGLSCSCDYEPGPGDWYYSGSKLDVVFPENRNRRVRCACPECGKLISQGETASVFYRVKCPYTDVECKIYGEDGEVPLAPHWLCEECSDLLSAFDELGFCVGPASPLRELAKEWNEEYGAGGSHGRR